MARARSPDRTGERLGPFRVLSLLGDGGMGSVYLAEHESFGTQVALKCLRATDEEAHAMFLEEARAMCRLDHPHVAHIFDHGIHGSTPWLAMELARSTLLDEAGALRSWRALAPFVRQLLDALAHAHARGVVHRDLKPSNVLVATAQDRRPGVKLVDFGIAAVSHTSLERAGTPAYMAPEQWSGSLAAVGPWTDLYAAGALLWTLCCRRPPVQEVELAALWGRQGRNDLDPFEPVLDVPEGLKDWLCTCLRAYPGERFASVPDALMALAQAEGGQSAALARALERAPDDVPTVRAVDTMLDLEDTQIDGRPLEARRRPRSAPVPARFDGTEMVPPPTHVAGTGLGALAWREPPVVGRGAEQRTLWEMLCTCETTRRPAIVQLTGPTGVGRSALGRWLVEQARSTSGARAVWADAAGGLQGLMDALLQPFGPPGDREGRERGLLRFDADDAPSLAAVGALGGLEDGPAAAGMVLDILASLVRTRTLVVFLDAGAEAAGLQALARRWSVLPGPALLVVTDLSVEASRTVSVPPLRSGAVATILQSLLPLHPSLVRQITDRAGGLPAEVLSLVARAAPGLRLGPQGFELPHGLPPDDLPEVLDALPRNDRYAVELLAHLDPAVPISLWAQAAGRRRTELLDLLARLVASGVAHAERGVVRLAPAVRQGCVDRARALGQSWDHHVAIATVLDAHEMLPMRRGQAWVDAGEHVRGVGVWLDHWRELVDAQGWAMVEGLLRDAEARVADVPPTASLHGRLEALLPVVEDRNHASTGPERSLASFRVACERRWYDAAVDHLRWAMVCAPPPQREELLQQGMDALRDRCAPGAWAALLVFGVMCASQWGGASPGSPLVRAAEAALTRVQRDPDCGHSTIVSPALLPRLRHRLDAAQAASQGDHGAEACALRKVVDAAVAARSPTVLGDRSDLGLALRACGRFAEAEQVFLDGERRARWSSAWSDVAGFAAQRAGLAVLVADWDRAARLARRAQLGLPGGYPVALMRLIAAMPAFVEGHLGTLGALLAEIGPDLRLVRPIDEELRVCLEHVQRALDASDLPAPAPWSSLRVLL